MVIKTRTVILLIIVCPQVAFALKPDEILVIANSGVTESVRIAEYYCARRKVPRANIFSLSLGRSLSDVIDRDDYEKNLAEPIRKKLSSPEFSEKIKCLLTTYGVPIRVGERGPLRGKEDKLKRLRKLAEQEKNKLEQLKQNNLVESIEPKRLKRRLARVQSDIDRITGKETGASVDSELSVVLSGDYELYRWKPNELKNNLLGLSFNTLMVSRLDGPGFEVAKGLVDKAIAAEKTTLKGIAYIDSRGMPRNEKRYSHGYFDQSLRDLAVLTKFRTTMPVKQEKTGELFPVGACPRAAVYCGWYSLKKYIDAFDFVDGAIGYHIASMEAVNLRDPNSSQWCPAMLKDGITATLGAVAEPYLHSFPEPKAFFLELFNGRCLVEAYYRAKPFNSWQLVLIGDPLYRPFKVTW
ncbi:MAG: TIGR03790 family protein [Planctomycetota bacterium]|jgi:uncharacterized protein (TIGR03790 family)